ncbi:hypothetical protein, partial [Xanthomonas vasicola]|uniref:hypothetical protein n=1 Tax=Xanthomonas vasicola TaxID=56459 RepID=UPI001C9503A4
MVDANFLIETSPRLIARRNARAFDEVARTESGPFRIQPDPVSCGLIWYVWSQTKGRKLQAVVPHGAFCLS